MATMTNLFQLLLPLNGPSFQSLHIHINATIHISTCRYMYNNNYVDIISSIYNLNLTGNHDL